MKEVIFLGKRTKPGSPLVDYPGAHLAGTTHSNQKWGKKYGTVDDWHSWWDLHPFDAVPGYLGIKRRRPRTYRWYQTLPGPDQPGYRPLWLAELDPTIPAGVLFPKEEVLDTFAGQAHGRFFTCQVDLMMAYHIMRGVEHIILHGHGTKFEHKHMVDHCGVLVWMTIARERGIKVTILPPSWYLGPKQPYGISPGHWGFSA
jgi:hypothetical protein